MKCFLSSVCLVSLIFELFIGFIFFLLILFENLLALLFIYSENILYWNVIFGLEIFLNKRLPLSVLLVTISIFLNSK